MNVLLHVPRKDIEVVLDNIWETLEEGGVFLYGVYGGMDEEKLIVDRDKIETDIPRLFSFLSDDTLLSLVKKRFEVISFHALDIGSKISNYHFQQLLLRKK